MSILNIGSKIKSAVLLCVCVWGGGLAAGRVVTLGFAANFLSYQIIHASNSLCRS